MGPLVFPPGREVMLDSNALIYSVEQIEPYWSLLRPLWEDAAAGRLRLIASAIVVPEVLVKPLAVGDAVLADAFCEVLSPPSMTLYAVDRYVLDRAAEARAAAAGFRTPDAVIAATAESRGAALVTNDKRLAAFKGVETVYLKDRLP